ncbi:MAG: ABC transporter substrate-binding protein [Syntrophomonadaceae bacterium]|nr:ABC transporter substrate-binding protein [Bacillota bacterium]
MKRRGQVKWAIMLSLIFMFTMVAGCGGDNGEQSSEDVIKLGFLGALTGDVANYGIPGEKGMRMAIDEINAQGGVLGKELVGIYQDNKGDSSEIANIAQRYITRDKVVAMVGDPCTGLTKVAADIAQKSQVVIFSAGATGADVVEIGDFVFRNTMLDTIAAPVVVDWMINEKQWTKFALITSLDNGYSTALTPIFEEEIVAQGGTIVLSESINDKETDFSAQITKLKGVDADVLVFTGYYTEAALILKEAQKQGVDIPLVGGDGLYGQDLISLGGDAVEEKIFLYCGFAADQPSEQTAQFVENYRALYNEEPDMFSAQYYDAVMILAQAMEKSNSSDPKVFKDEIAKLKDYPGVSGNTTIRDNREPIKSPVFLVTVKDGTFPSLVTKIPVNVE